LRLVVFNCCNSKAAAEKIVTELDGVVAIGKKKKNKKNVLDFLRNGRKNI
jgi:hypothetical protein